MNTDKLTEEVSTEDAKKKYKWAIIPIDKLPDDYPVIAIQEFDRYKMHDELPVQISKTQLHNA